MLHFRICVVFSRKTHSRTPNEFVLVCQMLTSRKILLHHTRPRRLLAKEWYPVGGGTRHLPEPPPLQCECLTMNVRGGHELKYDS